MDSNEIRSRFLKFFEDRGHKILPSSSLIPENDSSVLFTTAGMQQFKQYYTDPKSADKDFGSRNIVTVQKCVRTGDIDEVGDATHLTFLEMLGNFSFGGYGRREAITYAYDFITKELGLEISYVTVYKGEGVVPKDDDSRTIWNELGVKDIRLDGSDVFWGPTGGSGPCGPTTEIYCKNGAGEDVEIWNIVFNEYFCDHSRERLDKGEATLKKLDILGIDTGMGLERLLAIVQEKKSVYETDLFESIIQFIQKSSTNYNERSARIVSDHIRTAVFIIIDGVIPSNSNHGYILRRFFRRVFTKASIVELPNNFWIELIKIISKIYFKNYPEIKEKFDYLVSVATEEERIFEKPLDGVETYRLDLEATKIGVIKKLGTNHIPILKDENTASGLYIYTLFETFGIPIDLCISVAKKLGYEVDEDEIAKALREHQEKSRAASAGMFKGGLANHNEKTVKLHTAHHLLLAALKAIIGLTVKQKGSNITEERLRIDFLCDHKLTDEEKKKVEDWVNEKIKEGLSVIKRDIPRHLAEKIGAEMEFGAKYPDIVSVYFIGPGDSPYSGVSIECCGGPHVLNTRELGHFKILKEEAISQGVRRIKAALI
ncbi:hypothetical protein A3A05_02955 [Candidatus Nomurabacteria bacterium RIFCSPLOWO2_01_FULL_41_12]|uniref:alanine--tRNA ligase n=1 Tax=Candidatus Nomurabacteria bacterium RIFCSPLOWO2_01_FULL_41_12 TaxID=1801774 RepID=A0A1F6WXF5_9BACT|nr:MAG: hypothetical protein A2732_01485 [Candidatus Nomurabacteria bacterium RIFCSPHIGHO2_01_FULL_40_10]OGI86484.1 MAG: hypothetical protein A3A05_02955 [Candidatus Nomurabacteria bacterium RIFCSPLOWO2_01_FULL_41_12]